MKPTNSVYPMIHYRHLPIILVSLSLLDRSLAGLVVTDPTLIATNQANHAKSIAEQIVQTANQHQQINQLLTQIQKMDVQLKRLGLPGIQVNQSDVTALITALIEQNLTLPAATIDRDLKGNEIFDVPTVSPAISIDGKQVATRHPDRFRDEVALRRRFDHFRTVQSAVLKKRHRLKAAIARTTQSLQAATTTSEIQKLTGLLSAQSTELQAIDHEIGFAAAENLARFLRYQNDKAIHAKARIQTKRMRHRTASMKDSKRFRLFSTNLKFR